MAPGGSITGRRRTTVEYGFMALALRAIPGPNDDEALERLSRESPGWQLELDSDGSLIVSPTYSEGGSRDIAAGVQLHTYASRVGGKVFGSSTGFRLADNSVRSPDAAWLSGEHITRLTPEQRSKFWKTCPDVVIEILSASDAWVELLQKLDVYERNGARYVVGIDPFERLVEMRGTPPDGLVLDTDAIMDA